jgi:hypothetical protein
VAAEKMKKDRALISRLRLQDQERFPLSSFPFSLFSYSFSRHADTALCVF